MQPVILRAGKRLLVGFYHRYKLSASGSGTRHDQVRSYSNVKVGSYSRVRYNNVKIASTAREH